MKRILGSPAWMLLLVFLAAASSAASRTPIADFAAGGAEAAWTPVSGDYDHLVLTVAGPAGSYVRLEFPAGVHPTFGLFDEAGFALPDGLYKWELTLVPYLDAEMRARLTAARRNGQDGLEAPVTVERSRQSGFFSIAEGSFVPTDVTEPAPVAAPDRGTGGPIPADQRASVLTNSDGVIRNSLCVGGDCPTSPAFSDSTILMMENNTRIKFGDTSSTSSFPRNDWEIEANSSTNGGANYLGFNDCGTSDNDGGCATDLLFAVEAGARSSALYVESDGDIGIGTSNPAVDVHVVTGNTPTLRLEQDGSSGFTPQTWDVAGNETNFFVRDVTHGSSLPFRIRPDAPSSSIYIDSDGDVGLGTASPDEQLDVTGNMIVQGTTALVKSNDTDDAGGNDWSMGELDSGNFVITETGSGGNEFSLSGAGVLGVRALAAAGAGGTNQSVCVNDTGANFNLSQCSSSLRYKEDVKDLTTGASIVADLRPVEFRWRESGKLDLGFIAEEVAAIEPRLVTYGRNGEIEGVEYKLLTAVLVNALKEQSAELERGRAELARIEQRLAELESAAMN